MKKKKKKVKNILKKNKRKTEKKSSYRHTDTHNFVNRKTEKNVCRVTPKKWRKMEENLVEKYFLT